MGSLSGNDWQRFSTALLIVTVLGILAVAGVVGGIIWLVV